MFLRSDKQALQEVALIYRGGRGLQHRPFSDSTEEAAVTDTKTRTTP